MNPTPEDQIADAVSNVELIFKRYAPWVLIGIAVITILSISGPRRR